MLPCMTRQAKRASYLAVGAATLLMAATSFCVLPGVGLAQSSTSSALDYLHSCQRLDGGFGEHGEESSLHITLAALMAISSAGEDPARWTADGQSPFDYLRSRMEQSSPAAIAQFVLALKASGRDPRNHDGTNWVEHLVSSFSEGQFGDPGLLIDDVWAVRALAEMPEYQKEVRAAAEFLFSHRIEKEGWSWSVGLTSDLDNTCLALMALRASGWNPEDPVFAEGLEWAHGALTRARHNMAPQLNTPAVALHLQTLTALGTEEAPPGVASLRSQLLGLQLSDGSFSWTPSTSSYPCWNTAAAIPALGGNPLPEAPPGRLQERERAKSSEVALNPPPRTAAVTVRIEGKDELLWSGSLVVEPTRYTLRDGQERATDRPNVLGAAILALREAGLPFVLSGDYGDEVFTVQGVGPYRWFYRVNGAESELCQIVHPVQDGDEVVLFYGKRANRLLRLRALESANYDRPPTLVAEAFDSDEKVWVPAPEADIEVERRPNGEREVRYLAVAHGPGFVRSEVSEWAVSALEEGSSPRLFVLVALALLVFLGLGVVKIRRWSSGRL